jgi:hypothetical protein
MPFIHELLIHFAFKRRKICILEAHWWNFLLVLNVFLKRQLLIQDPESPLRSLLSVLIWKDLSTGVWNANSLSLLLPKWIFAIWIIKLCLERMHNIVVNWTQNLSVLLVTSVSKVLLFFKCFCKKIVAFLIIWKLFHLGLLFGVF